MKKIIATVLLSIPTLIFSQENSSSSSASGDFKPIKEGTVLVDVTYGFPYWLGNVIKTAANSNTNVNDLKVTNTNHIGGRIEYMMSDKISAGIEYTFARVAATYNEQQSTGSGTGTVTTTTRETIANTKQRILLRMSVHFGESEKFDPYVCFGAGYKVNTLTSTSSGLKFNNNLIPVAVRIGGGFRYFFTNNIGINVEAGIGGPVIQGGLSLKI